MNRTTFPDEPLVKYVNEPVRSEDWLRGYHTALMEISQEVGRLQVMPEIGHINAHVALQMINHHIDARISLSEADMIAICREIDLAGRAEEGVPK